MPKNMPGWLKLILKTLSRLILAVLFFWILPWIFYNKSWPWYKILFFAVGAMIFSNTDRLAPTLEEHSGLFKRYKTLISLAFIVLVILLVEWISRRGF
jgi:hypothetical protein